MRKVMLTVRFDEKILKEIDGLIEKGKFDNRPNLIRRAVNDFLEQYDKPVYS